MPHSRSAPDAFKVGSRADRDSSARGGGAVSDRGAVSIATAGFGVVALAAVLLAVAPAAATLVGGAGVLIVRTALVDMSHRSAVGVENDLSPDAEPKSRTIPRAASSLVGTATAPFDVRAARGAGACDDLAQSRTWDAAACMDCSVLRCPLTSQTPPPVLA